MRTCIICLPRTGSQLCEKMIASIDNASMLGEYFEAWNDSAYSLTENKFLIMNEFISKKEPFSLHSSVNTRIKKLIDSNKNQNFVLRLFLMDNYNKGILKFIISSLTDAGFKFVTIQRSLEDQLLSYCIAFTNFYNNNDTFAMGSKVVDEIFIEVSKIEPTIEHIARSSKNFNDNLITLFKEKSVNVQHIKYESITDDIYKIYQKPIEIIGEKTIKGSHLNLIINKEETITMIKKYLN